MTEILQDKENILENVTKQELGSNEVHDFTSDKLKQFFKIYQSSNLIVKVCKEPVHKGH